MFPSSYISGFYKAPVTKGLLGSLIVSHVATNLSFFEAFREQMQYKVLDSLFNLKIWQVFAAKLTFLDTTDLIVACILLYYMRLFERRYSSEKFARMVVASSTVAVVLEVSCAVGLALMSFDYNGGYLSIGPYGLIFAWLVNFYCEVACEDSVPVFGFNLSNKSLVYMLCLQLASSSIAAALAATCGVVSGILVYKEMISATKIPWVPEWLIRFAYKAFKWFPSNPPHISVPFGATIEVQRQNQIEMFENEAFQYRANSQVFRNPAQPAFARYTANQQVNAEPSAENIQTLVDMGFNEQRVRDALRECQNDVSRASHRLLQES